MTAQSRGGGTYCRVCNPSSNDSKNRKIWHNTNIYDSRHSKKIYSIRFYHIVTMRNNYNHLHLTPNNELKSLMDYYSISHVDIVIAGIILRKL